MKPVVVGVLVLLFTWSLTTHGKYSASGDEPHYLMVAQSLVADGDLDLANNYRQDDGRLFGHEHLAMETHARPAKDGRMLPAHDIGLPIVLLPFYVTAQRVASWPADDTIRRFRMSRGLFAYSLVSLVLTCVTAAAIALVFAALVPSSGVVAAAAVTIVAGVSPPVLSHAFLVFPEVPAFAMTAVVVWLALSAPSPRDRWVVPAVAFGLGLLPWMHRKYSFYVLGLAALIAWCRPAVVDHRDRRKVALLALLFVLPQVTLHAWTVVTWGTIGGPQMVQGLPFSVAGFTHGVVGLFADRTSGLVGSAPLYWIVPASAAWTWRRSWPFLACAALLYLPMASFVEWWAGFAPAARYIMPAVPLLLVPMAMALRSRALRVAFGGLASVQLIIDAALWRHPRAMWPEIVGGNAGLERLGGVGRAYEAMLPSLQHSDADWRVGLVIAVIALTMAAAALAAESASARIRPRT